MIAARLITVRDSITPDECTISALERIVGSLWCGLIPSSSPTFRYARSAVIKVSHVRAPWLLPPAGPMYVVRRHLSAAAARRSSFFESPSHTIVISIRQSCVGSDSLSSRRSSIQFIIPLPLPLGTIGIHP